MIFDRSPHAGPVQIESGPVSFAMYTPCHMEADSSFLDGLPGTQVSFHVGGGGQFPFELSSGPKRHGLTDESSS